MIRIELDCSDKYVNIIKRHLNVYFKDVEYLQNSSHDKDMILLLEVSSQNVIEEIKNKKDIEYIFLVNDGEYMFELLEFNPLGFMRTTHIEMDIEKLINILQYRNNGLNIMLDFKSGYQNIRVNSENIEYIESYGHYLLIHTESSVFKVREKISDVLDRLKPLGFLRVHKSFVVNPLYIKSKSSTEIILNSKTIIPIGKKYK